MSCADSSCFPRLFAALVSRSCSLRSRAAGPRAGRSGHGLALSRSFAGSIRSASWSGPSFLPKQRYFLAPAAIYWHSGRAPAARPARRYEGSAALCRHAVASVHGGHRNSVLGRFSGLACRSVSAHSRSRAVDRSRRSTVIRALSISCSRARVGSSGSTPRRSAISAIRWATSDTTVVREESSAASESIAAVCP